MCLPNGPLHIHFLSHHRTFRKNNTAISNGLVPGLGKGPVLGMGPVLGIRPVLGMGPVLHVVPLHKFIVAGALPGVYYINLLINLYYVVAAYF